MNLNERRHQIDVLDEELQELLRQRFELTDAIGDHKVAENLPVYDKERESTLMQQIAERHSSYSESIAAVYGAILSESRRRQESRRKRS